MRFDGSFVAAALLACTAIAFHQPATQLDVRSVGNAAVLEPRTSSESGKDSEPQPSSPKPRPAQGSLNAAAKPFVPASRKSPALGGVPHAPLSVAVFVPHPSAFSGPGIGFASLPSVGGLPAWTTHPAPFVHHPAVPTGYPAPAVFSGHFQPSPTRLPRNASGSKPAQYSSADVYYPSSKKRIGLDLEEKGLLGSGPPGAVPHRKPMSPHF